MTTPHDPPATPDEREPSIAPAASPAPSGMRPLPSLPASSPRRRGRPLRPIVDACDSAHRSWLEPVREVYLASGLTMSHLGRRLFVDKSKVSELMSGKRYPRWELLYALATELRMPYAPLFRLWKQAALETQNKSHTWVDNSTAGVTVTTTPAPPLNHGSFRDLTEDIYRRYASVFVPDERGRELVITQTFDQLWLSWPTAVASPDFRRYGWSVLRTGVMARTPHVDGRPDFSDAAFDAVTVRARTDEDAYTTLFTMQALFEAMSSLPDAQLDVMVLRRLCGLPATCVCNILGVPLAIVRSDERHATHFLELACPPSDHEGNPT